MVRPIRSSAVLVPMVIAMVLASAVAAVADGPVFVRAWGTSGSGDGQFITPIGVATDASGNVLVANSNNHRIDTFNAEGTFIRTWGWGVDDGSPAFQICTSGCQAGLNGAGDGQLSSPSGVAIDSSGNVYVSSAGNNRVQKFDASGNYVTKWGTSGTSEGQFASPSAIAVDSSGNVYVADTENSRVQKFDASGTFISAWGWGVDDGASAYQVCTSTCQQGDPYAYSNGSFNSPRGIAVDASDKVYVADSAGHRIEMFDANGGFLGTMGEIGQAPGQFYYPWGMTFDPSGNLYVVDAGNQRVEKFDPTLDVRLASWGRAGIDAGEFATPMDIEVGPSGNVYVSDVGNNRIQEFGPPSTSLSIKASRSVSRGSKVDINGMLSSTDPACIGAKEVELSMNGKVVLATTTKTTGAYRFTAKVKRRSTVRVAYAGSQECGASQTVTRTIRVT